MTLDEAKTLAAIASTVDSGCVYCVEAVLEQLNAAFPEFTWTMLDGEGDPDVEVRENAATAT